MTREIPQEILNEILVRLPVKDLSRFRCVSKAFLRLLSSDTHFIKLHIDRQLQYFNSIILLYHDVHDYKPAPDLYYAADYTSINDPIKFEPPLILQSDGAWGVTVSGICNGMVCFTNRTNQVCVWNPLTSDHILIPSPATTPPFPLVVVRYGFGFHPDTSEYKVVRLVHHFQNSARSHQSHASVYTLGTSCWRNLEYSTSLPYTIDCNSLPSLVNGALHWFAVTPGSSIIQLLVSFDTQNEVFREMALPTSFDCKTLYELAELRGLLCVYCVVEWEELDIWTMKEYGVGESWTLQFKIGQADIPCTFISMKVLGISSRGDTLILTGHCNLILYNPESRTIVDHKEFNLDSYVIFPFVASIASPKNYQWSQSLGNEEKCVRGREKSKFQIATKSIFKSCYSCTDLS